MTQPSEGGVDFVLVASREEGRWYVDSLPAKLADDLDALVSVLRQQSAEGGALCLVSVDEDFFVLLRVAGPHVRFLLSDVTAATEWPIARAVLQRLSLPLPADEERVQPAGDLSLLADFGVTSVTIASICDQLDLYPEDMLGELAEQLGFVAEYESAVDAVYG